MGLHGSVGAPVGRAGEERHCPRLGPAQTGSWALCTRCPLHHVSALEAILALGAWPPMAPSPQAASTATTLCARPPQRPLHFMLLPDPKFSYPLSKIILIIGKMEIRTPPLRLEKINCASVGKKCTQKPIASVRQAKLEILLLTSTQMSFLNLHSKSYPHLVLIHPLSLITNFTNSLRTDSLPGPGAHPPGSPLGPLHILEDP